MTWEHDNFGYEPGDVRYSGDVLVKAPPLNYPHIWYASGVIFVTKEQARRAEVFGWQITEEDSITELDGLVKIWRAFQ